MKVNIFKKLIREVVREELDYKFSALEKKLDEVLVSSRSNSIVEDKGAQLNSSPTEKTNTQSRVPTPTLPSTNTALTKDSILNDILNETAQSGEWKNIDKEAEVKSVTENTTGLPDHLADALTKDYSQVLKKADEIPQKKRKETLIQNKELALISKKLVTLKDDVPVKEQIEEFTIKEVKKEKLYKFRERKAETKASGKNKVVARQSDNPRHWKDERADQSDTSRTDKNVWSMQGKGGELSSKAKTMDEGYEKQKTLLKAKVKSSNRQPTKKELRELKRLARKEKRAKIKATRK